MFVNHLEELVAEWYEYQGYFVRRNVLVGPRKQGGYECELDIIAFNPQTKRLVQIEPSLDADSWAKREERFEKKFDAGKVYIPKLFEGVEIPNEIDQVALFVFASRYKHKTIGGGSVLHISDFLIDIKNDLQNKKLSSNAVPEQFPLLRMIQFVLEYERDLFQSIT